MMERKDHMEERVADFLTFGALEKCDILYVLVCTLKRETINGKKRFKWFEEHFFGNDKIKLIHVEDEVPRRAADVRNVQLVVEVQELLVGRQRVVEASDGGFRSAGRAGCGERSGKGPER